MGRSLRDIIGPSAKTLLADLPPDTPLIIYSWATWGPGSIELGRMLQARRFNAIGICLDTDLETARKAQHEANLGGKHAYDDKGPKGRLATLLKYSTAGQIYLVDKEGVIRDVRGGENLEQKLRNLDFQTPVLTAPVLSL